MLVYRPFACDSVAELRSARPASPTHRFRGAYARLEPQALATNPDGRFQLFRVGDALAGRNVHAAVYDGLRIARHL